MTTRSSPPSEFDATPPTALASLDLQAFGQAPPGEGMIFFCVENAPRRACSTRSGADGSLTFRTSLCGRVTSVEPEALVLQIDERETRIRYHLPPGITLDALAGQMVSFELAQIYRSHGRATIDAELCDAAGRMILWARDGHFPADRDAHGLSLRLMVNSQETRLAVRSDRGITSSSCPGTRELAVGGRELTMALVRVGGDDLSFALLRR